MAKLNYEIHDMSGFGKVSSDKYLKGVQKLIRAINSEEFKQKVLNYQWEDNGRLIENFKSPEAEGKIYTRKEIYDYIMSGKDKFNDEADGDIDIKVELYHNRWTSTVGYTYPNTWKTWINFKFFKNYSHGDIAGNIVHEYMHNLGFGHDSKWNSTRKHTVPYAIGTIIREIVENISDADLETPVDTGNNNDDNNQEETPVNNETTPVEVGYKVVCKRLWYTLWLVKKCWKVKK